MHLKSFFLLSVIYCLLFANNSIAQTIISDNNGEWSDPNTWNLPRAPLPGDIVMINGHDVRVNESAEVDAIHLSNTAGAYSQLNVSGGGICLKVLGDVSVTGDNVNFDVDFDIESTDSVYIGGALSITRSAGNASPNRVRLKMIDTSRLTVQGDFIYDYYSADKDENEFEIHLYNQSKLEVRGNTTYKLKDGVDFTFYLQDTAAVDLQGNLNIEVTGGDDFLFNLRENSYANVGGHLTLSNNKATAPAASAFVKVDTSGVLDIGGHLNIIAGYADQISSTLITGTNAKIIVAYDVNFTATTEGDASLLIADAGALYLGRDINKASINSYGRFIMDDDSKLYYVGKSDQTINADDGTDTGSDSFVFTNIYIDNDADSIHLNGSLTIAKQLVLTKGIIKSSETSPLIIADQATISGGNSNAYIYGPIIKQGRTNGLPFIFPTGGNGIYAPIEIEAVSSSIINYTAEFIGCPPPIEYLVQSPLIQVSQSGYWSLERNDANLLGNVTLHWDNANASDIYDLTTLKVSYSNAIDSWNAAGSSNIQGGVANQSGSIRNDIGCPPPIEAKLFTFGSTKGASLPVEMNNFNAFLDKNGSTIHLEWETLSEMNSDYFIVEKSYDGLRFNEIARVQAAGMSNTLQFYNSQDTEPIKGNNYYRIRQVDIDRSIVYSQIVSLFINLQDETPIVYPNPIKDQFRIYSKALNNNSTVLLVIADMTGKTVYVGNHLPQDGQILLSKEQVNIKKPGAYFVSFKSQGQAYALEILNL